MAAGQLNKKRNLAILYNALVIPGHLPTKRNLATCFGRNEKCPGLASHCTGIDRTRTRTRYSSSLGEPPRHYWEDN